MPSVLYPLPKRFWRKVRKTDGCWLWTGSTANGYGKITREGAGSPTVYAHRLSWELHFGAVPEGLWVLHRCDVRRCVRPDHLFLGTLPDNHRDMVSKRRHHLIPPQRGTANVNAKLTPDLVRELRARYRAGGASQTCLAREYGVSQPVVSAIVRGKMWVTELQAERS